MSAKVFFGSRLVFLLLLFGPAGILWGLVEVSIYNKNQTVTRLTMAEFAARRPKAQWVQVTGGRIAIPEALYYSKKRSPKRIRKMLLPVYPDGSDDATIHLYMETSDDRLIDLFKTTMDLDEKTLDALIESDFDRYYPRRTVEGLLDYNTGSGERNKARRIVGSRVAPDAGMITAGVRPSLGRALLFMTGGAGALALWAVMFFGKKKKRGRGPRSRRSGGRGEARDDARKPRRAARRPGGARPRPGGSSKARRGPRRRA